MIGRLLMSSIREIMHKINVQVRKEIHFKLTEPLINKINIIDIRMIGIITMPAPFGISLLWFPLIDGLSIREFFCRRGIIFFNA